jgi:hypothetical protein
LAANAGTLETIARQIGRALLPLQDLFSPDNVTQLFAELGLQFPPELLTLTFKNAISGCATAAGAISTLITQLSTAIQAGNDLGILQAGEQLIQQIGTTINSFSQVGTELHNLSAALPGMNPAEVTAFATSLPRKLLGYLLISYLEDIQPAAVGAGNLLGFLDYLPSPGVPGDPTHPPYIQRQLQLSKLSDVLSNPGNAFQTLYGWGAPGFDGTQLIRRLNASLDLLGIPSQLVTPTSLKTGLFTLQSTPTGLSATLTDTFFSNFDLTLPISDLWSLQIHMQGDFAPGITATIDPPANVTLHPTGTLNGQLATNLVAKGPDASHPFIVFGQTGGSRIQADSFSFGVGLAVTWDAGSGTSNAEPQITAQIAGGKVVIDTTNADGFLATVLSGVHVEGGFDLKLTWAPDTGIHFVGGAQLEIDLPLHLNLGPVALPTLYLVAGASNSGIPLELSAALGITLGPISASVDRVGVNGLLSFPDHGGNLGPADLSLAFKPPSGLGIAIDAGVLAGGGFIGFYADKGQYAGVFDAALLDVVQINIIAVVDTILPDGSKGYSFLMVLTFNFPPIQLSFGFTLTGVGGLVGVNRTMSKDALHAGFRAHSLNSVLFPNDPIKNAPQIISDIRNFFPPAEGRYLFGPMLQLGWGTPTLITLSLGVILEVPDPVRILILGLIDAGLPTADAALIEIHIDVLGLVDFAAKSLSIDGSMYDSHVLIYSMAGDLALRLFWGDNPNFLFSLGGVNPHFNTAGLDLPPMHRCSVSIGDGDNPRISANNYFAVTSNSVQFGANVEAYASAGGFAIHGYLGFDLIIIFSPFSFEFDFSAGFDVSFEGATLLGLNVHGTLSGPRPWHVHGDAEIDLFFFSVSASVNLTWGDTTPVTLPQKPVLPDLLPALQNPQNWSAALPDGSTQAVSFVAPKPDDKTLLVHPMGTLTVREKVVPLDLAITRYGNAAPADGTYFAISQVVINSQTESKQTIKDYFAAGQYLTLSDADKISHPSFELFDTGVTIGSSAVVSGADSPRTVKYDERYIDVPNGLSRRTPLYAMPLKIHHALVGWGAGFTSPLKNTGLSKFRDTSEAPAIATQDPNYVIAGVDDLAVRSDILTAEGSTYFQARAALNAHLALHPEDTVNLQILPAHEVAP